MATVTFGPFEFDASSGELRRSGVALKLQPQPGRVLALLISRAGQLVTREEIRAEVWGPNTFVDFEQNVNFCIRQIRTVLNDHADKPCYVETVPRRGYRFVAPVRTSAATEDQLSRQEIPRGEETIVATTRAPVAPSKRQFLWTAALGVTAVVLAVVGARSNAGTSVSTPQHVISVAVLPFESTDVRDYFVDGIAEELRNELSRLGRSRIAVIARTSVTTYKRTSKSAQQVGRELGADYVVHGRVQRSDKSLRIAAELVRVADNRTVWTQACDGELSKVLKLERDLARSIMEQTRVMTPANESDTASVRSVDPSIHEQVLLGRFFLNRGTRGDVTKAIDLLHDAVTKDPSYAPGYAGLADAYNKLVTVFTAGESPASGRLSAMRAAVRAIELDPNSADAYAALGNTSLRELDWIQANRALQHALELNPSCVAAHTIYSSYLASRGHFSEAIAEARRAVALDPVSSPTRQNFAWMLYFNHEYESAIQQLQMTLEMDPTYLMARWRLGQVHIVAGHFDDAVSELERAASEGARLPAIVGLLAMAYAGQGRTSEARRLLDELTARATTETVPSGAIALAYLGAGETEKAIQALERVVDTHDNYAIYVAVDPLVDALRGNARFDRLRERVEAGAAGLDTAARR
jgi:DNA-binding winged helix-turn-helix (wHTH) protein/TolB-like protein/Tfp pilus assembly protein PilF